MIQWLLARPWLDPILALLAIFAALAALTHFFNHRGR